MKTLLSLSLLLLLPTFSFATCYQDDVKQAIQAQNIDRLARLLTIIETETNCPKTVLDNIEHSMTEIATTKAEALIQQKQFTKAEKWLQRAPTNLWTTQVARAKCVAHTKEWQKTAKFYNQALDLIADPQVTPQAPPLLEIQKIFQLASEAQVLAGNLDATITYAGKASGMMRENIRGFKPEKHIIPLPFDEKKSSTRLSPKGKKVARKLGAYLKQYGFKDIILIGHQHPKEESCACVSKRYIQALKVYLTLKSKIKARIRASSQGDRQPLKLSNPENYTPSEIKTLNRRVEVVVNL
ncbi:MAG: hypothetical protein KAI17_17755 [Thiotrichaceae bacterium]|nr:hypothetical protein [Thiotrichaceae bacterium]